MKKHAVKIIISLVALYFIVVTSLTVIKSLDLIKPYDTIDYSSHESALSQLPDGNETDENDDTKVYEPSDNPESKTAGNMSDGNDTDSSPTIKDDAHSRSDFYIRYLDVGNADAALVCSKGKYMLIDGGNPEDSDMIVSVLKNENVSYLDYVICTHPHEDHVGGLSGALSTVSVGKVICSVDSYDSDEFSNFVKYTNTQGIDIAVPELGDVLFLGDAQAIILGPSKQYTEINNMSVIVKIFYKNTSFLFMGDAELEAETYMLDNNIDLACDVLKVGHHGSSTSSGYRFIREANPQYAIISCGKDNQYDHPNEEVLSRLADADVTVYRTDLCGDITAYSDGNTISVMCEKNVAE